MVAPARRILAALAAAVLEVCELVTGTLTFLLIAFTPLVLPFVIAGLIWPGLLDMASRGLDDVVNGGKYGFFVLFVAAVAKLADRRIEESAESGSP